MQKNAIIALTVVGILTAAFFLTRHQSKQTEVQPSALKGIYNQWKVEYNIHVGAAEDDFRFNVFSNNYGKIQAHNRLLGKTYTLGLNPFTHLTQAEFAATHLGLNMPKDKIRNVANLSTDNLKATADWTDKLNAVKNQGQCGSCWAFSAVGAIEGVWSVKNGQLYDLAEQALVDCSGDYGNEGCNGGLMDNAFQYVIKAGGLPLTKDYPYTATDGDCKTGLDLSGKISGFTDVKVNSPDDLKAAIAQQPVSVAIEADTFTFQGYTGGVINDASCGTNLDHGVVAVGYNDEDKIPYYKVRNSWGGAWGEKGYVRIGIQKGEGICGIQMAASYPTI